MLIRYRTKKLQKICENPKEAVKKYGLNMALKIHQRIDEIRAFSRVKELIEWSIGRCHELSGDRKGQYSMDLEHPYRLIFTQYDDTTITVRIKEIVDYH
mgnify:CR=1 FL=1